MLQKVFYLLVRILMYVSCFVCLKSYGTKSLLNPKYVFPKVNFQEFLYAIKE